MRLLAAWDTEIAVSISYSQVRLLMERFRRDLTHKYVLPKISPAYKNCKDEMEQRLKEWQMIVNPT